MADKQQYLLYAGVEIQYITQLGDNVERTKVLFKKRVPTTKKSAGVFIKSSDKELNLQSAIEVLDMTYSEDRESALLAKSWLESGEGLFHDSDDLPF